MSHIMRSARVNVRLLVILAILFGILGGGMLIGHKLRTRAAAQKALASAKVALAERNWPVAISQLRQYLGRHPDDAEMLVQYARAHLEVRPLLRDNYMSAMQAYRQYLRLRPDDRKAAHELGRLYINYGEFNEAAYIYRRLIEDGEAARDAGGQPIEDPQAWLGLATAFMLQHKHAEAIGDSEHAPLRVLLTRYPQTPEAYVLMCTLLEREYTIAVRDAAREVLLFDAQSRADTAETQPATAPTDLPEDPRELARAILDLGVRNNPDSALLRVHRARFRRLIARETPLEVAELEAARRDLEAAERLRPQDPEVLFQLFDEWYESVYARVVPDRLERAAAVLDRLAGLDPAVLAEHREKIEDLKISVLLGQARLAFKRADTEARLALAERWRELEGDNRRKFLPFATRLYLLAGRLDLAEEAVKAYKAGIEDMAGVNQAVRDSVTLLDASLAWARGHWYDVIDLVESIVLSGRTEGTATAPGLLAGAYASTGQHQRLLHLMELNQRQWLVDQGVLHPAVVSAMALNRWVEAERYARLLEQLEPENLNARVLRIQASGAVLAGSRVAADEMEGLIKETAALREAHPKSVDVRLLEAELLFNAGRKDEAIASLERAANECERPLAARMKAIQYLRNMPGRESEALTACRTAAEKEPEAAAPRIVLAELLAAADKNDEAVAVLEQAEREFALLEPQVPVERQEELRRERAAISKALAHHWLEAGERGRAIEKLQQLARELPSDMAVRRELLQMPEIADHPQLAQPLIDDMKRIEGERGVKWRLAQAQLWIKGLDKQSTRGDELRRRQEISAHLMRCIEADPSWEEPVVLLGRMYEDLEQDLRAEEVYRGWLQKQRGNLTVINRLLALLQRQRRAADMAVLLKELPDDERGRVLQERYGASVQVGMGDYDAAAASLEEKIRKDPNDLPAYVLLAALYQTHRKDAEAALKLLDKALDISPDFFDAFSAKIAILNALGRNDEAVRLASAEVDRRKSFEVYKLRADLYGVLGRMDRAEQDLVQLAAMKESRGRGHLLLGEFYEANGQPDKAIAAWEQGLAAWPDHPELTEKLIDALVHRPDRESRQKGREILDRLLGQGAGSSSLLLADAHYWLAEGGENNRRKARVSLEEAVRLNPQNVSAAVMLVKLVKSEEARHHQVGQARELLARALAANPHSPDLLMILAEMEAERGSLAAAVDAAIAATEADPRNLAALHLATRLALQAGQTEKAARCNEAASRLQPDDEEAKLLHARILAARGSRDQALKYLEEYCRTEPGQASVNALLTLAELEGAAGKVEASHVRLEQAAAIAPDDLGVLRARLEALAGQRRYAEIRPLVEKNLKGAEGDVAVLLMGAGILIGGGRDYLEDAVALYQRALELDPGEASALNNLAWLTGVELDRPAEALERYAEPGLRRYPNNPHLLDTRGTLYVRLQDYQRARADFEKCVVLSNHLPATHCSALLNLGRVYAELNETRQARASLLEAQRIDREAKVLSEAQRAELKRLLEAIDGT